MLSLPENLRIIGVKSFYRCTGLRTIKFSSQIEEIGNEAFSECSGLTSITIPEGVTSIGFSAFAQCENLLSITIPSSVTSIGDFAFRFCGSLTSITISEGVTSIGDHAFSNCNSLTAIDIPSSVTSIGNYAFEDCSNMQQIYFQGNPNIKETTFFEMPCGVVLIVPDEDAVKRYSTAGLSNIHALANYLTKCTTIIDNVMTDKVKTTLYEDEIQAINTYKTNIKSAKTMDEVKAEVVKAMKIIAIAEVRTSMDEGIPYLNDLIKTELEAISITKTFDEIFATCDAVFAKFNVAIGAYQSGKATGIEEGKSSAFGTMGEKRNGPAVIVTDQDDKQIILYSPKKVQYIKVSDK